MAQAILFASVLLAGCASSGNGPYEYRSQDETARNPVEAQVLTRMAMEHTNSDPERAEELLRQALTVDLYHGPAHNNLGVLYLNKGKLYEAASEFEWARKLMPGHPDPRLNLAMTLEEAGKVDEAIASYNSALEVYPGHMPSMQALTKLQIVRGIEDDRTAGMLQEISFRGQDEQWRSWARERLELKGNDSSSSVEH